jgi:hypothetical protein
VDGGGHVRLEIGLHHHVAAPYLSVMQARPGFAERRSGIAGTTSKRSVCFIGVACQVTGALRSGSDSAPIEGGAAPERKMRDPATQALSFGRHTSDRVGVLAVQQIPAHFPGGRLRTATLRIRTRCPETNRS